MCELYHVGVEHATTRAGTDSKPRSALELVDGAQGVRLRSLTRALGCSASDRHTDLLRELHEKDHSRYVRDSSSDTMRCAVSGAQAASRMAVLG